MKAELRRGRASRLGVYALLLGGAVLFASPIAWMLLSSVKTERELSSGAGFLPQAPRPRSRSPYLDARSVPSADSRERKLLPALEARLRAMDYPWPAGLDRGPAISLVARGLARGLARAQPASWWQGPPGARKDDLRRLVTAAGIQESLEQVERSIVLGDLVARSRDLSEDILVDAAGESRTWNVGGNARFIPAMPGNPGGRLAYDLDAGGTAALSREFTLGFPARRLASLKLYLRGDASWNRLNLVVEMDGRRLRSARPIVLSDDKWIEVDWQEYGPDDQSNKIRTWTLLRTEAAALPLAGGPRQIRIALEIVPTGWLRAWWEKLSLNYRLTLTYIPFARYVATSLFIVILQLAGTLASCSLVAYSFARLRWPGRRLCFALMTVTMIIPGQVTLIPHFIIMRSLGWYNTLTPLWITSFFATNGFFIFLLYQFLRGVPKDLEDAALIDGCGFWRIYWHVVLPLIRPGLAAIAILTFIGAWNDFTGPLVYISDQRLYPLSLGLYALNVQTGQTMGLMMAGALLMTLPAVALFMFAQRYFIQGVALSGMK